LGRGVDVLVLTLFLIGAIVVGVFAATTFTGLLGYRGRRRRP
jgi:hypothetical protein